MSTEIDWSKAPEDATHYNSISEMWYRTTDKVFADIMRSTSKWEESIYTVEEIVSGYQFVPRPVSANQDVSTEAETTVSAETHSTAAKPTLDLTPKNLWEEQKQRQRRQDIHAAMQRYIEAGKEIPNEWLEELMGLNNTLAGIETDFDEETQSLPVAKDGEWIEWGKNEVPDGLRGYVIEREYMDGEYRKGGVGEYTWNDDHYVIDCDTVKRYRIIQE